MDTYLLTLNIEFTVTPKVFQFDGFFFHFSSVSDDKHWQSLISHLIEKCICTADIVSPVVTSSSPEGFMIYDSEGKYTIIDTVVHCVQRILFLTDW